MIKVKDIEKGKCLTSNLDWFSLLAYHSTAGSRWEQNYFSLRFMFVLSVHDTVALIAECCRESVSALTVYPFRGCL